MSKHKPAYIFFFLKKNMIFTRYTDAEGLKNSPGDYGGWIRCSFIWGLGFIYLFVFTESKVGINAYICVDM